jgi:hypothetical protein
MTQFRDDRELPSTKVTKDLLKSLEQYIIERTSNPLGKKDEQHAGATGIQVSITDGTRTETIETIDQFTPTRFSDTTKSIELSYMGTSLSGFHITVRFEPERHFSQMRVAYEGPGAKEVGGGVVAGILECLAPHKTGNKWLHPEIATQTALAFMLVVVMFLWLKGIVAPPAIVPYIGVVLFCGIMYVWVWPWLKPFTTFDSPLTDRKDVWWKYMWRVFVVIAGVTGVTAWAKDHIMHWLTKAGWILYK